MKTATRTDTVLRLHVDSDGLVWYGDDGDPARSTYMDVEDFFHQGAAVSLLNDARAVRLLGCRSNAGLIAKLHEWREKDKEAAKGVSIRLGSPGVVPNVDLEIDPEAVLHHIWQPPAHAALLGSWHELAPSDYCTYAMINALASSPGLAVPELVRRIAVYHPAWPAVTFIPTSDKDAACRLLCDIIDPRWYRHPTRPSRRSRLYAHLGLSPDNLAACSGEGLSGRYFDRCTNAVRVWYNRLAQKESRAPGDFLLRRMDSYKEMKTGLLRGTKLMVDFVAAVWEDMVTVRHPEIAGFDPSVFFASVAVGKAYARHKEAHKLP